MPDASATVHDSQLSVALVKAQSEMKNATLNKVNPHFKSKYADLAAVREATLKALTENGLAIVQSTALTDGGLVLKTTLRHTSGESIESVYPLPLNVDKPQAMGSAITYARRYCWAAMCGISSDEDDDGNAAEDEGKKNGKAKTAAPKNDKPEEDPAKVEAERIKHGIDACKSQSSLDAFMKKEGDALARVKEHSQTAYDFLLMRAGNRTAEFSQEPL